MKNIKGLLLKNWNRIELNEVINSVNEYINNNNKSDSKLKKKIEEVSEILSNSTNRLI